ncbi:AAA family ATPase [Paenibacillus sp. PsM32]|uniref:AAA family ATPase n=1 Tax=unclassified Paenibacillus TaxID=185978 RepID=UPI0023668B88|nr:MULTISPECIES: AAA family ATPase [unclassified Paenibacillus]MDN4617641.1 AAA family ATPase [Paenibacillus sp. PsM32]WDF52902.1 AAA family ATPase [Paenibacillus sp. KACC 21273]
MTTITLERLTLRNFKGLDEFVLVLDGKDVAVHGTNATGKTTIVDAFYWLLFGKDSNNRTDFQIKKLDGSGKVRQHMLEHEVEGVLQIDGITRTFRRVFAEKWTKKRGQVKKEFTGHETSYFVDDVPLKEAAYKEEVAQIIREDLFRLLTNPIFFNEHLNTDKRRGLLLEVCGDVTDVDVIQSNKELTDLLNILNGHSIEDHQKVVANKKRLLNQEIEKIPVRIDEVRRSAPDISNVDTIEMDACIQELHDRIAEENHKLQHIQSDAEAVDLQNEIRRLEGEALDVLNRLKASNFDAVSMHRKALSDHQWAYNQLTQHIESQRSQIQNNQRQIDAGKSTAQTLRTRWIEVKAMVFEHEHQGDDICAACGQPLPADQVQIACEKAEATFNVQRAQTLEQINVEGKATMKMVKDLEERNQTLAAEIESLKQQQADKKAVVVAMQAELDDLEDRVTNPQQDEEYLAIQQQILERQHKLTNIQSHEQDRASGIHEVIATLRIEAKQLEQQRAQVNQAHAVAARIHELEQQESRLAEEYEQLEYQVFLMETFIRTKVNMLEKRINSKFKCARFKLFDKQINGGLKEVCETTYNGVPYSSGLNHAARINVGLDIINTLAEHCGVTAPIFLDNAESVVQSMDTHSQMIRLIVSKEDTALRIEKQEAVQA